MTFTGSNVALVTPFREDGSINFDKLTELVEWHIAEGTDGIVACGTTGEASTLSADEHIAVVAHVVKTVGGRIPVVAGAGSNSTAHSLHLSREAARAGADGLLLITPYYNKTNDEGLYRHFTAVAGEVPLPVILYNVPGRTGMSIPIGVLQRLAAVKNIVAIKEASGDMDYVLTIAREVPGLIILSGNDSQILPVLSYGGLGVISVAANVFPKAIAAICSAFGRGNLREATRLQVKYSRAIAALFLETNPIPVKEAMNLLGHAVGGYRLPLCEMSAENRGKLERVIIESGITNYELGITNCDKRTDRGALHPSIPNS